MRITSSLTMRLAPGDKALLEELAWKLQRSQTDTVRVLVRETLAILKEQEREKQKSESAKLAKQATHVATQSH